MALNVKPQSGVKLRTLESSRTPVGIPRPIYSTAETAPTPTPTTKLDNDGRTGQSLPSLSAPLTPSSVIPSEVGIRNPVQPKYALDNTELTHNLRAIERHLDDDHYIRGFTPTEFVLVDATATMIGATAATPRWPVVAFADAATSRTVLSWRKPTQWRTGKLRLRFWYTSPVGSTANFYTLSNISAVRDTEVLTGTLLGALTAIVAGPAVANTVVRSAYQYTTTSLGGDDELFSLQFARLGADAADTNVNSFHLLYVEIEHIPAVRESE